MLEGATATHGLCQVRLPVVLGPHQQSQMALVVAVGLHWPRFAPGNTEVQG